jgi:hypothetical protein
VRAELGSRIHSRSDSVVDVFSRLLENVTQTALGGCSSVVWNSVVSLLQPLLIGQFAVGQHDPEHFFVDAVAPLLMQELRSFRDLFGGAKSAVNVTCLSCNKVTLGGGRVTGVEGRGRGSRKHRNGGSGKSSIL